MSVWPKDQEQPARRVCLCLKSVERELDRHTEKRRNGKKGGKRIGKVNNKNREAQSCWLYLSSNSSRPVVNQEVKD